MSKLITIFTWEIMGKIKRKSFWFSTLFIPFFIYVISSVPFMNSSQAPDRPTIIGFADGDPNITENLVKEFNSLRKNGEENFILMNTKKSFKENIKKLLIKKEIDIAIVFGKTPEKIKIFFIKPNFKIEAEKLRSILLRTYIKAKVNSKQLPPEIATFPEISVSQLFADKSNNLKFRKFTGAFAVILIFISSILFAGGMFIRSIAEEKSNRIIELLLTSCSPQVILLGKTLGLISVNFLQLSVWVLIGVLFFGTQLNLIFALPYFTELLLLFIVGYFFFTFLFVSIGAFVKTDNDAQQILAVISVILILPVIVLLHIFTHPFDLLTHFLLYFPLTSVPTAMLKLSTNNLESVEFLLVMMVDLLAFFLLLVLSKKYFGKKIMEYGGKKD